MEQKKIRSVGLRRFNKKIIPNLRVGDNFFGFYIKEYMFI